MINVWWTTEKRAGERDYGVSMTFWISEETGGYRVAKVKRLS
jgi:hypothetical protein